MSSVAERLAAVRERLASGRSENLKAVDLEAEAAAPTEKEDAPPQYSDVGDDSRGSRGSRKRRWEPFDIASDGASGNGVDVDVASADEADGENDDARMRSMKRRARGALLLRRKRGAVSDARQEGKAQAQAQGKDVDEAVLVYGGKAPVDEEAVDTMVEELQQAERRRSKFRRRRVVDDDKGDITFINEGNRMFNRSLNRYYDKFDSVKEIKDNIERGTA